MSKRRISKQQTERIKKIQQTYQAKDHDSLADGLVISRFGKYAEIESENGTRVRCSIRPNIDTLVAGDRVIWQTEGISQGVVVSLYPRASVLARPTSTGIKKPVAANITQLIIVISAKPEINWPLLDSYLIIAETLKLHAVILLNKTDLPSDELKLQLNKDYKSLGYPIIMSSIESAKDLDLLKKALDHQISVFVGQSGVGKSSLISRILPHEENIAVGSISTSSDLGRHTTSNSKYYHIPSGGALIDSPGVREFSLWDMNTSLLAQGYREFQTYISNCKYRNCTHIDTPNCGVIEALHNGQISQSRYDNFVKLSSQFAKK